MMDAEQIKAALKDRRLQVVARATGLSYPTVKAVLDGQTGATYKTIKALSDYFSGGGDE